MKNLLQLLILPFVLCMFSLDANAQKNKNSTISLKETSAILYVGDEVQIKATSKTKIVYSAENEFYATVSPSGLVTAEKIGETSVLLTNGRDTRRFRIIVKSKSNLYAMPNLEWGISRSALIRKIGKPSAETATGVVYQTNSDAAPTMVYVFDKRNRLKSSGIIVDGAYRNELNSFLNERYIFIRADEDGIFYADELAIENISMGIGVTPYGDDFLMVTYYPLSVDPESLN